MQGPGLDLRGRFEEASDNGQSCYETISPSLVEANRLLKQRDELAHLCGEMLATMRLPGNQESFAKLGPQWPDIVAGWRRRYQKHSGDPNRDAEDKKCG